MTHYFDTSDPGAGGPLTASKQIFAFGRDTNFYLWAASETIPGQSSGAAVSFYVYSEKSGLDVLSIDYGQAMVEPRKFDGYLIDLVVPSGAGVSIRVAVDSEPISLGGVGQTVLGQGNAIGITNSATPTVLSLPFQALVPPANSYWLLQSAVIFLETDATAGNREVALCLMRSGTGPDVNHLNDDEVICRTQSVGPSTSSIGAGNIENDENPLSGGGVNTHVSAWAGFPRLNGPNVGIPFNRQGEASYAGDSGLIECVGGTMGANDKIAFVVTFQQVPL